MAENNGNTSGGGNDTAPKYYLATATEREPSAPGAEKQTITFVVEGPDYKTAWQNARKVTRVGSDHFGKQGGNAWTDNKREAKVDIPPDTFTVGELKSLQERRTRRDPVTLVDLERALAESNVNVPKAMRELIDQLKESGPSADASAEQPAAAAAS